METTPLPDHPPEPSPQTPSTSTITPGAFEALISTFLPRFSPVPRTAPFELAEISHIATLLSIVSPSRPSWAARPRVYIVLRLIGCLDLMQAFVVEGKGDEGLPYQIEGLPADLNADESVAGMFLERQGLVIEGIERREEKDEAGVSDGSGAKPETQHLMYEEPDDEFIGHAMVPTFSIQHTYSQKLSSVPQSITSVSLQPSTSQVSQKTSPRTSSETSDDMRESTEGGTDKIFRQDSRSEKIFRQESKYEKIPVVKRKPVSSPRNLPIPAAQEIVGSGGDKILTDGGSDKMTNSTRESLSIEGGGDKMARFDNSDKVPVPPKWDIPLSIPLPTEKYPVYPTEPAPSISTSKFKGSRFKKIFSTPDKPIFEASKNGDANAVASIVRETGPAVNRIMDNDNWTPLHWASRKGHSQIVHLLLENRMPVDSRTKSQDREPLFFAAQSGYLETCRLLLAASADPNAYSKMDGATALHRAAMEGHERVCALLISSGANADARDKEGMGPLMWAVQGDRGPVIQTLVSNGARLEARSEAGMTALHRGVAAKNVAVTRLLLSLGADVNADGPMSMHPLHRAAANGKIDMVALLIEFGAGVRVRTVEGWTPLHCAARHAHEDVGKLLTDAGADRWAVNRKGLTPRQLAIEWGFFLCCRELLIMYKESRTIT